MNHNDDEYQAPSYFEVVLVFVLCVIVATLVEMLLVSIGVLKP